MKNGRHYFVSVCCLIASGSILACDPPATSQWHQAAASISLGPGVTEIHFVSSQLGWALRGGHLLVSIDSGGSWDDRTPPGLAIFDGRQVAIVDAQHFRAAVAGQESVTVAFSDDGGANWNSTTVRLQARNAPRDLKFVDPASGWVAVGGDSGRFSAAGYMYATTDGGKGWGLVGRAPVTEHIEMLSAGRGFAMGTVPRPQMARTTDAGKTWTDITPALVPPSGYALVAIAPPIFFGTSDGLLLTRVEGSDRIGATAVVKPWRSTDNGETWSPLGGLSIPSATSTSLVGSVSVADGSNWAIAAGPTVYMTSNGGQSWQDFKHDWTELDPVSPVSGDRTFWAITSLNTTTPHTVWALLRSQHCSGTKEPGTSPTCRGATVVVRTADGGRSWSAV